MQPSGDTAIMQPVLFIALLLVAMSVTLASSKSHVRKNPSCQEFSQGVQFKESEVYGAWHTLRFASEDKNGSENNCLEFTTISDQERKTLAERLGKYVENLKWETLTLKMKTPCDAIKTNSTHAQDYYLEKVGEDGSYRSFQVPPPNAKLDLAEIHRYPMRLKIIEEQYLGMMDCHEKFVFVLGRHPINVKDIDEKQKKLIESFMPEEF